MEEDTAHIDNEKFRHASNHYGQATCDYAQKRPAPTKVGYCLRCGECTPNKKRKYCNDCQEAVLRQRRQDYRKLLRSRHRLSLLKVP
jgi:hypothetical protein